MSNDSNFENQKKNPFLDFIQKKTLLNFFLFSGFLFFVFSLGVFFSYLFFSSNSAALKLNIDIPSDMFVHKGKDELSQNHQGFVEKKQDSFPVLVLSAQEEKKQWSKFQKKYQGKNTLFDYSRFLSLRSKEIMPLNFHPIENLQEKKYDYILPKISSQGQLPWKAYARSQGKVNPSLPQVSFVMMGLGLDEHVTLLALRYLPVFVTLCFSPYSPNLSKWVRMAHQYGHEVMLTMPLEPLDFPHSDQGTHALMTHLSHDENQKRLNWILSRTWGYIGFVGTPHSKFSFFPSHQSFLKKALYSRGLIYLDPNLDTQQIQDEKSSIDLQSHDLIDKILDEKTIEKELIKLKEKSKDTGYSIGLMRAYPLTIFTFMKWFSRHQNSPSYNVIPISALVKEYFAIRGE